MKNIFREFKKFAVKGNAVDLAVGVIIGAAFGKVINSLVEDIIMPPISILLGGVDFSDKVLVLKKATAEVSAITFNYGFFLDTLIDFLIISWAIFIVVKYMNKLNRKEEKKIEKKSSEEAEILKEIRDTLRKNARKEKANQ